MITESVLKATIDFPGERDTVLRSLGLTQESIDTIRESEDSLEEKILEAAIILKDKPSSIKGNILAAIVRRNWVNYSSSNSVVNKAIKRRYFRERKKLEEQVDMTIPNIHLLRVEAEAYAGNLIEARRYWKNFQPSTMDWTKSVKIPITFNKAESILLGAYWGDALIRTSNGKDNLIVLSGKKTDYEFYDKYLSSLIQYVHGIDIKPELHEFSNGNSRSALYINSQAILTWLRDDMGLKKGRAQLKIPEVINNEMSQQYFLAGVIATKGNVRRTFIDISSSDLTFIEEMEELVNSLGYSASHYIKEETRYVLSITSRSTRKLHEKGLIINPNHSYTPPNLHIPHNQRLTQIEDFLVVSEIKNQRGLTVSEIAHEADIDKTTAAKFVKELIGSERIYRNPLNEYRIVKATKV